MGAQHDLCNAPAAVGSCGGATSGDASCTGYSGTVQGECEARKYDSTPNTQFLCPVSSTAHSSNNTCVSDCSSCSNNKGTANTAGVCQVTPTTAAPTTGGGSTAPSPTPTTKVSAVLKRADATTTGSGRRLAQGCTAAGNDVWIREVITEAEKDANVSKAYYVKCETAASPAVHGEHTFLFDVVGSTTELEQNLRNALASNTKIENRTTLTVSTNVDSLSPKTEACSAASSLKCTSPAVTDTTKSCANVCIAADFGAASTLCCKADNTTIDSGVTAVPSIFVLLSFLFAALLLH